MENENEKLIDQLKTAGAFIKQLSASTREAVEPDAGASELELESMEINFNVLLAVLSWSTLSTDELHRYIGAFRYDLLQAMEVISQPTAFPEEVTPASPTGKEQVLHFMQRIDQRLVGWMSVVIGYAQKPFVFSFGTMEQGPLNETQLYENSRQMKVSSKTAEADLKIVTLFSVKQLGFWIRLQKEHGVIENENIALLVRLFSRYYQTRRAENISDRSLYNDYFDTNQFDAAVIRSALKDMLERVNSQYFP